MEQPLSDIKVMDLTWHIAGPYCTKLLADYGADVIKIEEPGEGDPARRLGPFLNDEPHPEKSGLFLYLNTNKRGVTLNLKSETGKKIFKELVKDADILVESFSPRVLPSLGLDYGTLEKINSRLLMISISNFGKTGPYRDFRGSDLIYQGLGGAMHGTGTLNREPLKKGATVAQYQAGVLAAVATMIAFYGVELRGYGDHVDVSGVRTDLTSIDRSASMLTAYQYSGRIHRRIESRSHLLRCKDGYIGMMVGSEPLVFQRMAKMLSLTPEEVEEWGNPIVLADPKKRAEFADKFLEPWLLERTQREIVETAQAATMLTTPLNSPESILVDPHYQERGFWVEIDHPVTGKLTYPGAPFRMGEGSWQMRRPAPLLGQHNEEVYGKLGYSKDDLVQLRQAGVI